eukprot:g2410.t1
MAAIVVKVFSLALRTISKPLGHQFQNRALQHPGFRKRAIALAQILHRMEVYITRGAEGKESRAFVGAISDEKAMDLAAKVVSEGFVFTVAVVMLTWEYSRSWKADAAKKLLLEQKEEQLRQTAIQERQLLQKENEQQTEMIQKLVDRLEIVEHDMKRLREERILVRPWWRVSPSVNKTSNVNQNTKDVD